jgi:serine/threonine protein kinase
LDVIVNREKLGKDGKLLQLLTKAISVNCSVLHWDAIFQTLNNLCNGHSGNKQQCLKYMDLWMNTLEECKHSASIVSSVLQLLITILCADSTDELSAKPLTLQGLIADGVHRKWLVLLNELRLTFLDQGPMFEQQLLKLQRCLEVLLSDSKPSTTQAITGNKLVSAVRMRSPFLSINIIKFKELQVQNSVAANVYRGTWRRCTPVAIKVCRDDSNGNNPVLTEARCQAEIQKLSALRHPRLVSLLGYCTDFLEMRGEEIISASGTALVLEFMEKGSLRVMLTQESSLMTMLQKLTIAVDICEGMRFLHESNVSHGDLTSETVLVDGEGRAKLSGFGGGGLNRNEKAPAKAVKEMSVSDQQADIVSFGVILWQLITGRVSDNENVKQKNKINLVLSEDERRCCPAALLSCINQCLDSTLSKQITFSSLYGSLHAILSQETKKLHTNMENIPHEFNCPITQDIMKDPVILADGHTYEREFIVNWLKKSNRSPLTNEELKHKRYITNRALKSLIEAAIE